MNSCKDLLTSYIYEGKAFKPGDTTYTINECVTSCSGDYPIHDSLTDPLNPKCVSSCRDLIPSAFISKDGTRCTRICATDEVIDSITDEENPKCESDC